MVVVVVMVKVVKVEPETCSAQCWSPSSRSGDDSPLICTFFFILQCTKLMRKNIYNLLNAVLQLLFYSTAFNFIMRFWCQVSCKRWAVINWWGCTVSVSLFSHLACLMDQKVGWLTKESLRYKRGVVQTNWCECYLYSADRVFILSSFPNVSLWWYDPSLYLPLCLWTELDKQKNRYDCLLCPDLNSIVLSKFLTVGSASLPPYAEIYSGH